MSDRWRRISGCGRRVSPVLRGAGQDSRCSVQGKFQCADIAGPAPAGGAVCGGARSEVECGGAVGFEGVSDARGIGWLEFHISEARCGAPGFQG